MNSSQELPIFSTNRIVAESTKTIDLQKKSEAVLQGAGADSRKGVPGERSIPLNISKIRVLGDICTQLHNDKCAHISVNSYITIYCIQVCLNNQ